MVYRGIPQSEWQKDRPYKLGIKPTAEDHAWVKVRWMMGFTVRELCVLLGERYKLAKPLSRMTLYHHHRVDMPTRPRGRKPNPRRKVMQLREASHVRTEMKRLIREIADRRNDDE